MTTTRIDVADARRGQRVRFDFGDTATITKVHRPRGANYLALTYVDDKGDVFKHRYLDGTDGPTNWTLDIVTPEEG